MTFFYSSPDHEKIWNSLDDSQKEFFMKNISQSVSKMENRISIEFMAQAIDSLSRRVEKLEEKNEKNPRNV